MKNNVLRGRGREVEGSLCLKNRVAPEIEEALDAIYVIANIMDD
jgi:hypothetical protein